MKRGYMIDLVIYDTVEMRKGEPPNNVDYDIVTENFLDDEQFLTGAQVIERLRLLHDALETYKSVEANNVQVIEEMRLHVDGLLLAACETIDCTEDNDNAVLG